MQKTVSSGGAARPAPYRGPGPELVRGLCAAWLRLTGWRVEGDWPDIDKAVVAAAPHTSNWDGLLMLAAAGYFRVKLRWMGKESLTRGPFGGLIRRLGCVAIDRSARHDMVQAMADAFSATDRMYLAIPPEGTRSLAPAWKSGFYHIACAARTPIIISVLDFRTKTVRIAEVFHPTGDYAADLPRIQAHYQSAEGKYPEKFAATG